MADPTIFDDADDPGRAIRIGDPGPAGEGARWGYLLTLFMRIMALFWLAQGLMQWRAVLTAKAPIFDIMPQNAAFAVVFFAVLDLVAGVGLWLATPWGGVLWLLIASAQIFVASSMPGFFSGGYWLVAFNLVLIALYFALTFEAGRDLEAKRVIENRRRRRPEAVLEPLGARLTRQARKILSELSSLAQWRRRKPKSPEAAAFEKELDMLARQSPAGFQPRPSSVAKDAAKPQAHVPPRKNSSIEK